MTQQINAVRFRQWLDEWSHFEFDAGQGRRKPDEHIYLFSMPAVQLRALSGVYRRRRDGQLAEGLQRMHDAKRSATIRDFVRNGYPHSSLPVALRNDPQTDNLKKPGWLPTAIVVNILRPNDLRRGRRVAPNEIVEIQHGYGSAAQLTLPYDDKDEQWSPAGLEPIEVIDGQHRLWAFDEVEGVEPLPGDFELPVVAFHGLDIGWQAYLFWSINVSPKKINPSHAFDLFPLLRSEAWLETFSELRIYREARAQELTQLLYELPASAWYLRINMLGETGSEAPPRAGVTQAGWARALMSSFLAPGGRGRGTKGLFSAAISSDGPLPWSRPQQAAFLVAIWNSIKAKVANTSDEWAAALRTSSQVGFFPQADVDDAFDGKLTMLNQEQGVRGVLIVANDLFFLAATEDEARFAWHSRDDAGITTTSEDVAAELQQLVAHPLYGLIEEVADAVASYDWRSAKAPGLTNEARLTRHAFRGSGGYGLLRTELLNHLAQGVGDVAAFAQQLVKDGQG